MVLALVFAKVNLSHYLRVLVPFVLTKIFEYLSKPNTFDKISFNCALALSLTFSGKTFFEMVVIYTNFRNFNKFSPPDCHIEFHTNF